MLLNKDFEINNLIRLASAGLEVAEFVDIRDALIRRYKEVYGSDIDLSTATADGVFVNDIALIINNILQVLKSLYSNLDVDSASGVYLDTLCKLANVTRLRATHSIASLLVTNTSDSTKTFGDLDANETVLEQLTFVDNAGTEWLYRGILTLSANESKTIQVKCVDVGAIDAPASWINKTLLALPLDVVQSEDAIRGENVESDSALRKRRAQSSGAAGITVLESLVGALLEVAGIRDVHIYNNNSSNSMTAKDDTVIPARSIYVIIRQTDAHIDNELIGEIIFNKLTPGINTTETSGVQGDNMSHEYVPKMFGSAITGYETMVYWKKAKPQSPAITIEITPTEEFVENTIDLIFKEVQAYANNIKITEDINKNQIFMAILDADPTFKGRATYMVNISDISIESSENEDSFYNYKNVTFIDNTGTSGKYVITITGEA